MTTATLEAPIDQLIPERILGARSLRHFIRHAWPIVEPATPYLHNWHIDAISDHLMAVSRQEIRKLIINVPPGSAKSLIASVLWPAWDWIESPHRRFLCASYAQPLSTRDALKSRRIIQSTWFQDRWGDHFRLTGDQNAKLRFENDKTGYRVSTSVGGATGERANIRLLDDPHNIDEAQSDTIRESVVEWYKTTWSERGADAHSADILIMQRLHENDVCGYILRELGGYEHLMLPMEFDPKRRCVTVVNDFRDPRTEEGELLFPARWDRAAVAVKQKNLGTYGASGQLQQSPSPDEGGILKKHWWRYWHYPGQPLPPVTMRLADGSLFAIEAVPLPWTFDEHVQSWDLAFKDTVGCDPVGGQDWVRKGADAFLRDRVNDRLGFPETVTAVRALRDRWKTPPGPILIEDKANGPAVIAVLQREISGILACEPYGSKTARVSAYSYLAESGNVYLPHPSLAPWVEKFIDTCAKFPNDTHDEDPDCWSQAMDKMFRPEDAALAITPEYSARFHAFPEEQDPVPGLPSFRFWNDDSLFQCCILGQTIPGKGTYKIALLDCLVMENGSIEALCDRVQTLLNSDYRGVSEWRDIGHKPPLSKAQPLTEHHLIHIVNEKLAADVEPGEPDFALRVSAIKGLLAITGRLAINRHPSEGESRPWIHEALNGGYAFHKNQSGQIVKTEARKNHVLTVVGDCLGHGLARVFQRKPIAATRVDRAKQIKRAVSYSV